MAQANTSNQIAGTVYMPDGMDSGTMPTFLSNFQYNAGMNVVQRGGILQTRPGYNTTFSLPCEYPQGIVFFQPTGSVPYLVMAVGGLIYTSAYNNGFREYKLLPNVRFSNRVRNVYWAVCNQFTERDAAGEIQFLREPRDILIMQDGVSRAAFWDGENSGHIDPTPSPHESSLSPPGFDGTPPGEWMAWAGNRLWVARNHQVFASDIGNPLKFKESQYLAEGRAFYMPEDVTGMIQPTLNSPLIVFGQNTNTRLRADIQDRAQWATTADMQLTDNTVGCVAGRSLIQSFGLVWWMSAYGITNLNAATQLKIDSRFRYLDNQMAFSKGYLNGDKTGVCGLPFENYLLWSVPSASRWNRHTWCYDQLSTPQGNSGWASIWTGTRPLEWTTGIINGQARCWYISADEDGVNRVWEAFDGSRTDNGCPITCWVQTKAHDFDSRMFKRFDHADMWLGEILGNFDISVYFGSEKGAYQRLLTRRLVATPGIYGTVTTFTNDTNYQSFKPQTRYLRTESNNDNVSECNECSVEATGTDAATFAGTEFSLLLVWSGRGGLKAYRVFTQTGMFDKPWGECGDDEAGLHVLTEQGCSTTEENTDTSPFVTYTDAATEVVDCPSGEYGDPSIGSAVRTSIISANDATKRAQCAAFQDAMAFLNCSTFPSSSQIISEAGDDVITQTGDNVVTE